MKIYVNQLWEICALRTTDRTDLTEIEVTDRDLGQWCDAALFGYRYEPHYIMDENGDLVLDENGNKIPSGWMFYPFIDFNIIMSIQHLYEQDLMSTSDTMDGVLVMNLMKNEARNNNARNITDIPEGIGPRGETTFERIKRLYDTGRLNNQGIKNAVDGGLITEDEYFEITGLTYPNIV